MNELGGESLDSADGVTVKITQPVPLGQICSIYEIIHLDIQNGDTVTAKLNETGEEGYSQITLVLPKDVADASGLRLGQNYKMHLMQVTPGTRSVPSEYVGSPRENVELPLWNHASVSEADVIGARVHAKFPISGELARDIAVRALEDFVELRNSRLRPTAQEQKPTPSDPQSYANEVVALLMQTDRCTAFSAMKIAELLLTYQNNEREGYIEELRARKAKREAAVTGKQLLSVDVEKLQLAVSALGLDADRAGTIFAALSPAQDG